MACIADGIAQAYYKDVSKNIVSDVFRKLSPELLDSILHSKDANQVLSYILSLLNEPKVFLQKVQAAFANHNASTFDTLYLKDIKSLNSIVERALNVAQLQHDTNESPDG